MTDRAQPGAGDQAGGTDHMQQLTRGELQLLSRLCQAGGGRARKALATILGETEVNVALYDAGLQEHSTAASELAAGDARMIGVLFDLSGSFEGHLTMLLTEPSAWVLAERLVGEGNAHDDQGELTPDARAALAEVGNIVASAFLNAFADALRTPWLPSPPKLIHDRGEVIVQQVYGRGIAARALAIALDAHIEARGQRVRGQLLFLPSAPVVHDLIRAAGGAENR